MRKKPPQPPVLPSPKTTRYVGNEFHHATDHGNDEVTVLLPHRVLVTCEGNTRRQLGLSVGNWYIIQNTSDDAIKDPNNNWDVGSNSSGLKLAGGFTFQEARRIALAVEDSEIEEESEDTDIFWLLEAIMASALMDHYVYPLSRYFGKVE